MELFDVYHQKDKVLVFIKQKNKEPITFMIQGITKPIIKKPIKKPQRKRPARQVPPSNTNNQTSTTPNNTGNQSSQPGQANNIPSPTGVQ